MSLAIVNKAHLISTKILPSDLSIVDLLEEIKHHLIFEGVGSRE